MKLSGYGHTDKLKSYNKAHRDLIKKPEHRFHERLNNRAANSNQPTREKEKQMRGFKMPGSAQRFLASMGTFLNLLKVKRYAQSAKDYRKQLKEALAIYNTIVAHPQSV